MSFREGAESVLTAAVDPLGIGRSLAGREAQDPIGEFTQRHTNDAARNTANTAVDVGLDLPDGVKAAGTLLAAALFAIAFGQLFNINIG